MTQEELITTLHSMTGLDPGSAQALTLGLLVEFLETEGYTTIVDAVVALLQALASDALPE